MNAYSVEVQNCYDSRSCRIPACYFLGIDYTLSFLDTCVCSSCLMPMLIEIIFVGVLFKTGLVYFQLISNANNSRTRKGKSGRRGPFS
jgi:hypothetical protein